MHDSRLFVGLMSGTSCDGVDAALIRVDGHGAAMRAAFLHLASVDYDASTRQTVADARANKLDLNGLAEAGRQVALRYAEAVRKLLDETNTPASAVAALAAHGQTIHHAPPLTWQLFDPTVLAHATGIDVVSDLRRADCASGGQGAPLVPFGDWVMFRHPTITRLIINIGGIANVTVLPAGANLADVRGYDIGPGNCLSDWLMRNHGGVDFNGDLAMTGTSNVDVVSAFREANYFHKRGPKSTDVPNMLGLFKTALELAPGASLPDRLATAGEIVGLLIACCVEGHHTVVWQETGDAVQVYVAGGGVHNRCIMDHMRGHGVFPKPTDALGVPTQAREAAAFALLAAAHLDRFPCHMPLVTGATRPAILGSLTPAAPVPVAVLPGEVR